MPPEAGEAGARALALIVHSGSFDRVHYALATAAAAAALGRPVTLFFTMQALQAVAAEAGWQRLKTEDGRPATLADATYAEAGLADFESLVRSCSELGVRVMACEMGLKAVGLERAQIRADIVIEEGGLATLMLEAAEASLLYV